jgi:hypothetical protein
MSDNISIEVNGGPIPRIEIIIDENSAQAAKDAYEAILLILQEFANTDISLKLDKGGFKGTAQTLSDSILAFEENLVPLQSKFTLVQKITDNLTGVIELGDLAHGFGPGSGEDLEYWPLAKFLNLTGDNNVNNYLNYKPISVSLPNS